MTSDIEPPPSPAVSGAQKRRGRPRQASPTDSLQQRVERAAAELKEAQEAVRQHEERRANISGHACLRHARHNVEFARHFAAALRAEVKSKAERAIIADLLENS